MCSLARNSNSQREGRGKRHGVSVVFDRTPSSARVLLLSEPFRHILEKTRYLKQENMGPEGSFHSPFSGLQDPTLPSHKKVNPPGLVPPLSQRAVMKVPLEPRPPGLSIP